MHSGIHDPIPTDDISAAASGFSTALEWKEEGNRQVREKNYPQALAAYEKALNLEPDNAVLWNNKGMAFAGLGCLAASQAALSHAVALDPTYEKAKERLRNVESKMKVVFESPKPKTVFYGGESKPVEVVEKIIGKPMASRLWVLRADLPDFMHYSLDEITANFLKKGFKPPQALSAEYFNIIDMKEYGRGVVARRKINKDTVMGYYFGKILKASDAKRSGSPYSLGIWNDATDPRLADRYAIEIEHEWSVMSLLQHLPRREELGLYTCRDKTKVACANVGWDTINLFGTDRELRGAAIVVMYALDDIEPGQLLGFDYGLSYFFTRKMQPVLFDHESLSAIAGSGFQPTTTPFSDASRHAPFELPGMGSQKVITTIGMSFAEYARSLPPGMAGSARDAMRIIESSAAMSSGCTPT